MFGILFINTLELIAFISGLYYYRYDKGKATFYLICFLGFTVVVELLGHYTNLMDIYNWFEVFRDTRLENNYWLYNIYLIVSALFYANYFQRHLKSQFSKKLINILSLIYLIGAIAFLIISGVFYTTFSPFTVIAGTLLVLVGISLYYLELLKSDEILSFNNSISFYVSVAVLIFYICTTPLFIYGVFFVQTYNPEFVTLYKTVIFSTNFIMYSLFIIGFLLCARSKKLY